MRIVLAAATAAFAAFLAAQGAGAAPGPQCGGTLWKQMTLADNGKGVNWNPKATTIADIAKLTAPARVTASRTTSFTKQVWKLADVVIERYRLASNGEVVLELYDIPSSTYMDAYLPSASCMTSNKTLRTALVGARTHFLSNCPAVTPQWQILGAHASIAGVGFWNPVKTTMGALQNGAELRPLVGLAITQGCGKF
ncbi:MAG: hypothetical protein ABUS54_06730 [Actinomycetota bacterium]